MKSITLALSILIVFVCEPVQAQTSASYWTEDYTDNSTSKISKNSPLFSQAELAQMLAPIALYPDSLLTHILIASTYPIELVQAQRWLDRNSSLSSDEIYSAIDDKDWDASVKALVPFPRVLKRLNDDLAWTQQLGDAFLSNEAAVLASIQELRQQAEEVGSLAKMANSTVRYDNNAIIIESAQPQVVYVPYYDTRTVYGTWHWRHYPPVYWSTPRHFYSSYYYDSYYQPFYWHSGVHISFNYFFGAFHWHKRHVVVSHHYKKHFYRGSHHYRNRHKIVSSSGAKRWYHKPHHRRGVAYSNKHLKKRFHSNRETLMQRKHKRNYAKQNKKHVQRTHHKGGRGYNATKKHNRSYHNKSVAVSKSSPNKQLKQSMKPNLVNKHAVVKKSNPKRIHQAKQSHVVKAKKHDQQNKLRKQQRSSTKKHNYSTTVAKTKHHQHNRNYVNRTTSNKNRGKSQKRVKHN